MTKLSKNILEYKSEDFMRDWTGLANPLVLFFFSVALFGFGNLLIKLIGIWFINEIACLALKYIFFKDRPNRVEFKNFWTRLEASSFPSIHASRTAVLASFVFLQPHFDIWIKIIFIFLALLVGYTRVYLKRHFWVDVMAGWLVGVIITLFFIPI